MADAHAHERLLEPRERPPGSSAPRPLSAILTPWFAFLGGAAAWVLHLTVGYSLSEIACGSERLAFTVLGVSAGNLLIHLLTLVAGITAIAAAIVAYRLPPGGLRADPVDEPGADEQVGRTRFIAYVGVLMNGVFLIAILAGGLPYMFLRACNGI